MDKCVKVEMTPSTVTDHVTGETFDMDFMLKKGYLKTGSKMAIDQGEERRKLAELSHKNENNYPNGGFAYDLQRYKIQNRLDLLDRELRGLETGVSYVCPDSGTILTADLTVNFDLHFPQPERRTFDQYQKTIKDLPVDKVKRLMEDGALGLSDNDYRQFMEAPDKTAWLKERNIKGSKFNLVWIKEAQQPSPNIMPIFQEAKEKFRQAGVSNQFLLDFQSVAEIMVDEQRRNHYERLQALVEAIQRLAYEEAQRHPINLSGKLSLEEQADKLLGPLGPPREGA